MENSSQKSLYSLLSEFTSQFTYKYEAGLDIDIEEFFQRRKERQEIQEFSLTFDTTKNYFSIQVNLVDSRLFVVHALFLQFLRYIALSSGATLYTSKKISNCRRYVLVLLGENKTGYCCEIDFIDQ